ncbi:unnamed protein product, partial [Gordionus sp. m RMFG-2023]
KILWRLEGSESEDASIATAIVIFVANVQVWVRMFANLLATIHDNSTGRSAKHHRRRLDDSTQVQSSFSPNRPAPSANRGELMDTSSGHSSIASTEDILKRAICSIHKPAPSTSTSSAVSQRIDAMDLWENQLQLS